MTTPDQTLFVEPSFRAYQPWTPQLLLGAELLCDGGTMRAAADLCDQMLADDRLLGIINKRVYGVLGLDLTFDPARGRKSPVKALEADEDWWAMYPEEELGEVAKWGFLLGLGLGQTPWKDRGKRVCSKLTAWNPRHLTWDWTARVWKLRIDGGKDITVTPGDGTWMMFTPYGAKRPWAKGLWRGLSRWWLLKQYAIYDWGKYSERHGQGTFVGEATNGQSPGLQDRKQLAADLQAMGRAASIVLPPGYTLKLVEATANNWQTFKAQCDMANMAFAITLLGNNLSTEVTGGSFAAADVHKVVEATVLRFTAKTIEGFTHDQGLCWWAEFNFGNADFAPWPNYAVEPPEDLKSAADLLVAFGTSLEALARFKIPVDLRAMCERFNVPLVEGAEVPELELPPPAPNPFGAPPANDDNEDPDEDPDDDKKPGDDEPPPKDAPPPPAAKKKKAAHGAHRAKASKKPSQGQKYADAVAAKAMARAHEAVKVDVDVIRDCVAAATSYADLKTRLVKALRSRMNPKALAKILHDAAMMSSLAGRASETGK